MRSFVAAVLAGVSTQILAHPGHGLVAPHVHSDWYLLIGIAVSIAGAIAAWKMK
ncbi:MAG: hypothetical protein JWN94_3684 [Betaproteobacteria bacterium]|nr:hypothetical protein [Betaproteobacteria bacterium]